MDDWFWFSLIQKLQLIQVDHSFFSLENRILNDAYVKHRVEFAVPERTDR